VKKKKAMAFEIDEGEAINWGNRERAYAQLMQLVPEPENWGNCRWL
jgi:hypothetical protein